MQHRQFFAFSVLTLALNQVYAAQDEQMLDDVVVSASRIEQNTKEAPANVTVINAKKLESGNNFVLGDALTAKVPSLYLRGGAVDGGRPGTTMQPSFRGMGISRNLLLVDGQSMTDAYTGQINWSAIALNDVERIEVVPGAGSALYGSAAMGGVISVITKAPVKRELTAKISKGFSDGARTKVDAGYRDKFENGLGMVLNFSQDERAGYATDLVTVTTGKPVAGAIVVTGFQPTVTTAGKATNIVGDKGVNASKAVVANAKIYYDLTPVTKLHAGINYTEDSFFTTPYHLYLTNAATGLPLMLPAANAAAANLSINGQTATLRESAFFGSTPGGRSMRRFFAGLDSEVFGNYKLKLQAGRMDQDSWSTNAANTDQQNTLTSGLGTMLSSPNSKLDASAELSFAAGDNQFIVAGLAFERGELNGKKIALANWSDLNSKTGVNLSSDGMSATTSLFLQDQIAVGDKLTVYAGGRYDAWRSHGTAFDFKTPANNVISPERTASSFNPKLAAVYKFRDDLVFKGSLGTGFRAPNNYEMYANPTFSGAAAPNGKLILANPNLKPETSQSWDVSAEKEFAHGGNFKFAYYETQMKDMIYQTVTPVNPPQKITGTTSVYYFVGRQNNVASANIRGVELSGDLPVTNWLSANASYTYTGAIITSDGGLNTGMVGKRISNVPKNMASLGLAAKQGAWSGALSTRYIGEVYGSSDNLNSDLIKDIWTGYSKYWLTDMKVGYQFNKNFKAGFAVGNLFDKKYFAYYPMPGRSVTVEIAGTF